MIKVLSTIVIILLLSIIMFPQEVIKEKVEIKPGNFTTNINQLGYEYELCDTTYHVIYVGYNIDYGVLPVWFGTRFSGLSLKMLLNDSAWNVWNVSIVQGFEYVMPIISRPSDGDSCYFYDPGSNFTVDNGCSYDIYLYFNKRLPDSVARVQIDFTNAVGTEIIKFDLYRHLYHLIRTTGGVDIEYGKDQFIGVEALNQCGNSRPSLPDSVKYKAEIIKGGEFGGLFNPETGEYGSMLNPISNSNGIMELIKFIADGERPVQNEEVIIRISTTDDNIEPIDIKFNVKPLDLNVEIVPSTIAPGDTARIIIKKKNPDGTLEDFPSDQFLEVGMLTGCNTGTIVDCYDGNCYQDNYFYVLPTDSVYFVADSSADTGKVNIRVGIIEGGGGISTAVKTTNKIARKNQKAGKERFIWPEHKPKINKKNEPEKYLYLQRKAAFLKSREIGKNDSNIPDSIKGIAGKKTENQASLNAENNYCFPWSFESVVFEDGEVEVSELVDSIMLGETKYYQAKQNNNTGKIKIEEIKPDANGIPQQKTGTENGWQWLTTDVWGDNPVTIEQGDNGVYWEKSKPVWKYNYYIENGKEHFTKQKVGILPTGIIRLIGRYWQEGKKYKVKLSAKASNGFKSSTIVKVIKPNKLGTSYQTAKDDDSRDVNIDNICIAKGGELGIPPQYLKGQMRRETSSYHPFNPTYLYEPWTTQFIAFKKNPELSNNIYFVPDGATTFNPVIINYANVRDYHYPITPVSVWYMIKRYSTIVDLASGYTIYGKRNADGSLSFAYRIPKLKFKELQDDAFKKYYVKNHPENTQKANNEARENFINFYKIEWDGGITYGNKGLINIKAQTRMAASYGLLQILFTTAIGNEVGYPEDNPPEKLLDTDNLKWPLNLITYYLNQALENENNKDANWSLGFEKTFESSVYHKWNKRTGYPIEVLTMANLWYKPIK